MNFSSRLVEKQTTKSIPYVSLAMKYNKDQIMSFFIYVFSVDHKQHITIKKFYFTVYRGTYILKPQIALKLPHNMV